MNRTLACLRIQWMDKGFNVCQGFRADCWLKYCMTVNNLCSTFLSYMILDFVLSQMDMNAARAATDIDLHSLSLRGDRPQDPQRLGVQDFTNICRFTF